MFWFKIKHYTKDFTIIFTSDFRDRSLSWVWLYKWIPIEFNLIDEYVVKIDRYYYDRYELRYLFTTKIIMEDVKMFRITKQTNWYDERIRLKKK